jgi:hypothetical protein
MGADVVITGRVVDSALVLGPLIHEFDWSFDDYDRMAAGSLIGHLIECGAQASGGLYTDWREVGDYTDIGYSIAECYADGTAVMTKPERTTGVVSVGSVGEQLLYEIGDPSSYHLPDVIVDFTGVRLEQVGKDRVSVSGVKGRAPGPNYKAIATWDDGWMGGYGFFMRGPDAAEKARLVVRSILNRMDIILRRRDMPPFRRTCVEIFGNEESYGAQGRNLNSREIMCRVAVDHVDPRAIGMILGEQGTAPTAMAPGIPAFFLLAPLRPVGRSEAFFLPSDEVPVSIEFEDRVETLNRARHAPSHNAPTAASIPRPAKAGDVSVTLRDLAWVRSGDKGDICNIGVIARRPEYLPYIAAVMDEAMMARHYQHMLSSHGHVRRYYLPGSASLNFLLDGALEGGCTVGLRFDALGKSAAQEVLEVPISIPAELKP